MDSSTLLILSTIVILLLGGLLLFRKGAFAPSTSKEPNKNNEIIVPLRLQAYERMCLYLERITPEHLLLRLTGECETSLELQQQMLHAIREEYNHNLAQQIYITPSTWESIKLAKDEIITLINQVASTVSPTEPAIALAKKVMENYAELEQPFVTRVIHTLKNEIQSIF